jgi:heat shock protein HslJ
MSRRLYADGPPLCGEQSSTEEGRFLTAVQMSASVDRSALQVTGNGAEQGVPSAQADRDPVGAIRG